MPAQEKLSQTEQYLAYVAGLGIIVAILALALIGLGTFDNDNVPVSLLLIGLALILIGAGGWLIMVRPWEKFDDLKTPQFTGHEEHAAAPVKESAPAAVPVKPAIRGTLSAVEEKAAEPVVAAAADVEAAVKEVIVEEAAPPPAVIEEKPAAAVPDDLTLIEGIGPKSAEALRDAGITTFAQIAQMSPEELEKAVKDRKVRLVGGTETWPMQAKLAAEGNRKALQELQGRLKGGAMKAKD